MLSKKNRENIFFRRVAVILAQVTQHMTDTIFGQ